jgi:hypothetical protein
MVCGLTNREEWDGLGMLQVFWKSTGAYLVLMWKFEGKRPIRKPRRKWEGEYCNGCLGNLQWGAWTELKGGIGRLL